MKRLLLIFILILPGFLFSQIKITVEVTSKALSENENIFISGNNESFGNWNPGAVQLNKSGKNKWKSVFSFPKGTLLEFKLTKGSWETEAQFEAGVTPGNFSFTTHKDTTVSVTINHWSNKTEKALSGQITGQVEYIRNIGGTSLLPRDVIVWLPPAYNKNSYSRFPVLYMHDGQNIIDPGTSAFGTDWQIDETIDSLINHNLMNDIIVVGIYNSPNRRTEYSPTDTGYAYMRWLVKELKPLIDKTYRTKPDREFTAVAGSSMGGLISFMLVWEYSDVFSKAACFSPAFLINKIDYVRNVNKFKGKKKHIKIYIDNGGKGLEERLQPGIDAMTRTLLNKGYEIDKDLITLVDKNAEHNEAAWALRTAKPLLWFFGKQDLKK